MSAKKLTGADKAAIVLLALGDEAATELFAQMTREEVRRIGGALARLGRVEQALVDEVCAEFHEKLVNGTSALVGSASSARRLMSRALGDDALALDQTLDLATPALVDAIAAIEERNLATVLRSEHPQTIALVLAHADARKAGAVLKLLPEHFRVEAIQRMARLGPVDPEILHDIEETLRREAERQGPQATRSLGGADKVAALVAGLDKASADALLDRLEETDPDLAAAVRAKLFQFSDLVSIDDRGIQELLKQVPQATLKTALKSAPEAVQAHLYRNMSQRAAETLREDLAAAPKMRMADVEAAQSQIAQLARKLADEGKIQIRGKDEVYV